ncbi:MAG: endonuclease domain-containing protein [Bacteroidota bacterium]
MNAYQRILAFAREMRKNPTPAERFCWQKVRNRKLDGKKFNRQFVIQHDDILGIAKFFIADFYCHAHRLVIELDGKIHQTQLEYDQIREDRLIELGYQVVRFSNEQVISDWQGVEEKLRSFWT